MQLLSDTNVFIILISAETNFFFFWVAQRPTAGSGLIHEISRAHNDAPHSLGILWKSDEPGAETST